jgi:hypothetical protein
MSFPHMFIFRNKNTIYKIVLPTSKTTDINYYKVRNPLQLVFRAREGVHQCREEPTLAHARVWDEGEGERCGRALAARETKRVPLRDRVRGEGEGRCRGRVLATCITPLTHIWGRGGGSYKGRCQQREKKKRNPHALAFGARVRVGDKGGHRQQGKPGNLKETPTHSLLGQG